jgi:hypothetical protein
LHPYVNAILSRYSLDRNLLSTSPKEFLLDRRSCTLVVAGDRLKSLHLENCSNCVLRVDGKLKSLALVDCFNVCVHFDGAIASFSALRCERLRVAARGACSTFTVEASPQCAVAFAAAASPRVLITSSESPGFTLVAAAQAAATDAVAATAAAAAAPVVDIESGADASVAVESAPPAAADASAAVAAPVGAQWPQTYEELIAADAAAESASIEGVSHQPTAGSGSVSAPNVQLCTLWNGQEFVTEVAKRESLGSYVQNFRTSE